jgi:hypothetical protein
MTDSEWWDKSWKLLPKLIGHAQQILSCQWIAYWCASCYWNNTWKRKLWRLIQRESPVLEYKRKLYLSGGITAFTSIGSSSLQRLIHLVFSSFKLMSLFLSIDWLFCYWNSLPHLWMIYGVLCDGKMIMSVLQLKVWKKSAIVGFSVFT